MSNFQHTWQFNVYFNKTLGFFRNTKVISPDYSFFFFHQFTRKNQTFVTSNTTNTKSLLFFKKYLRFSRLFFRKLNITRLNYFKKINIFSIKSSFRTHRLGFFIDKKTTSYSGSELPKIFLKRKKNINFVNLPKFSRRSLNSQSLPGPLLYDTPLLTSPLLTTFTHLFFNSYTLTKYLWSSFSLNNFYFINTYLNFFYFYTNFGFLTNLFFYNKFQLSVKKKITQIFNSKKLVYNPASWYSATILRFLEFMTGKKTFIKLTNFLNEVFTLRELMRCILWSQKLKNFQKMLGKGLNLLESVQVIYLCLKLKDPYLFIDWVSSVLNKISFWKHRLFFHYIRYVFRYFFWEIFTELKVKGFKIKLKGKISVAGNARTRTIEYKIGKTSYATFENRILQSTHLVRTFTGVMGLNLWLVF